MRSKRFGLSPETSVAWASRPCTHRRDGEATVLLGHTLKGPSRRRGVTLLEVLLALGLMVLVSSMLFAFYHSVLRTRRGVHEIVRSGYLARNIAHRVAEEIRAANGFVTAAGPGISGTDRLITIQTVAIPGKQLFKRLSVEDDPLPAESDIRQVQYYLAYDDEETYTYPNGIDADAPLGLVRREVRTLYQTVQFANESESVDLDLISPELKYVRFRYFDGVEWIDRWDIGTDVAGRGGNSLPQAVEITVGYTELPPPEEEEEDMDPTESNLTTSVPEPYSPNTYSIVVRLPQADAFFGSRMQRAQRRSRLGQSSGS